MLSDSLLPCSLELALFRILEIENGVDRVFSSMFYRANDYQQINFAVVVIIFVA